MKAQFESSYQPSREGNSVAVHHRAWAQSWLPDDANWERAEQRDYFGKREHLV